LPKLARNQILAAVKNPSRSPMLWTTRRQASMRAAYPAKTTMTLATIHAGDTRQSTG
jgi:hypothetical protein